MRFDEPFSYGEAEPCARRGVALAPEWFEDRLTVLDRDAFAVVRNFDGGVLAYFD